MISNTQGIQAQHGISRCLGIRISQELNKEIEEKLNKLTADIILCIFSSIFTGRKQAAVGFVNFINLKLETLVVDCVAMNFINDRVNVASSSSLSLLMQSSSSSSSDASPNTNSGEKNYQIMNLIHKSKLFDSVSKYLQCDTGNIGNNIRSKLETETIIRKSQLVCKNDNGSQPSLAEICLILKSESLKLAKSIKIDSINRHNNNIFSLIEIIAFRIGKGVHVKLIESQQKARQSEDLFSANSSDWTSQLQQSRRSSDSSSIVSRLSLKPQSETLKKLLEGQQKLLEEQQQYGTRSMVNDDVTVSSPKCIPNA